MIFSPGHALRGRVSRNLSGTFLIYPRSGHALRGRVSRNFIMVQYDNIVHGHALRGRVSRNESYCNQEKIAKVTPCVGV